MVDGEVGRSKGLVAKGKSACSFNLVSIIVHYSLDGCMMIWNEGRES